jgi:hypothetical protein
MVCIGYVGLEAFDIILYVGQIINKLRYPVLIIDLCDTGALTKTICHEMDLDSKTGIVHYRNLNYIRRVPEDKELEDFDKGVVFVAYGLNYKEPNPIQMDLVNIVVDSFPNNIDKINLLIKDIQYNKQNIRLLIRDIISVDDIERTKESIMLSHRPARIDYLYLDHADYENAVRCQTSQVVQFRNISSRMRKTIINEIYDIVPGIKKSNIRRAVFLAERGRE